MQEVSIVISGAAGQGIQTVEQLLVGIFKKAGFHIYASKEYQSRIRGGSNSTELRIGENRMGAFVERIDLLIPFTQDSIKHIQKRLTEETMIIADESLFKKIQSELQLPNTILLPFKTKALEMGNWIYANVIAVGAIAGLFNIDPVIGEQFIEERFSLKGFQSVEENKNAFLSGISMGNKIRLENDMKFDISSSKGLESEIILNGNEAVALGAIAGGCNFISAYPMSPSTGVLDTLAHLSNDFEIVIDQAEDEIAAINKGIAAWYAGARALVSTSGGGFALMTEGLSLAGMLESPLVIHIGQRPGPATGLPTRTAQEDLNQAIYGGHGEFCRLIFAPGTIEQAFYLTQKAFNIADEFQIPVFILTDQDFVDSYYNVPRPDLSLLVNKHHFIPSDENYLRYRLTKDGLSPRAIPGLGDGLVRVDSDEHDEIGHITEDLEYLRPAMVEKRLHKRRELLNAVLELPTILPDDDSSTYVVCWGSNFHVIKEAISTIEKTGISMIHFHQLYPLPPKVKEILSKADKVLIFENNASGQFAKILKLHADFDIPEQRRHLRYSGKPWSVEEVAEILKREGI